MKFHDLPKETRLLIFMLHLEANANTFFSIAEHSQSVIDELHITKNKHSLSSMLYTLSSTKGHIISNKHGLWRLRMSGQKIAIDGLSKCDSDIPSIA